jgi:NADH-quinone oxidoreductase subunit N
MIILLNLFSLYLLFILQPSLNLRRILNLILLLLLFHQSSFSHSFYLFEGLIQITPLNLFHLNYLFILFFLFNYLGPSFNNIHLLLIYCNIIGIISLILSYDFILIFISLELINLSLYLLIGNYTSGIKYFILSIIISTILLLGFILLYNSYGTLNLDIIYILSDYKYSLGFSFILFSIFFKLGIFPFHQWSPDLLSGISYKFMFYIHIFIKFGYLILFYNLHTLFLPLYHYIFFLGLLSMFLLALSLSSQFNLLRFLALSSISHLGFLILQFNYSFLFYIYIYFISSLFFLLFLQLRDFYFHIFLSFILFSFSGLPPLPGFYSKLYILID